jgi:hypothetical protein
MLVLQLIHALSSQVHEAVLWYVFFIIVLVIIIVTTALFSPTTVSCQLQLKKMNSRCHITRWCYPQAPHKPWYVPTHHLENTADAMLTFCRTPTAHHQDEHLIASMAAPTPCHICWTNTNSLACATSTSTTCPSPVYATLNAPLHKSHIATTHLLCH